MAKRKKAAPAPTIEQMATAIDTRDVAVEAAMAIREMMGFRVDLDEEAVQATFREKTLVFKTETGDQLTISHELMPQLLSKLVERYGDQATERTVSDECED